MALLEQDREVGVNGRYHNPSDVSYMMSGNGGSGIVVIHFHSKTIKTQVVTPIIGY